ALHVGLERDVADEIERLAPGLADARGGLLRGGRVDVGHHDTRPLLGKEHGRLAPHAHAAAGDEGDLSGQAPAHQILSKLRISSQSVTTWSKAPCSSRAVCR